MSFLLCCMTSSGNTIDNNIKKNTNDKTKQNNKLNIIPQQVEGIQTKVYNENDDKIIHNNTRRNSKNQDTLIDIGKFEKCQYWFTEVIKYSINDYQGYGNNKKELNDHIFKFVKVNKSLKFFKKYNKKYNNFDKENIIKFCKDPSNEDFIQDIRISENIYRFH